MTLSSSEPTSSWGPLQPFVDQVMQGNLDGFEIPYEALELVPPFWPDGIEVRQYKGKGILLFREGAHENYGYASSEEFQSDVEKGVVLARTLEGALSVGRARLTEESIFHLSMKIPGLPVSMRFIAQNLLEAKTMQEHLQRIVPEARIYIAQSEITLMMGKVMRAGSSLRWSKIKTLPARKKKALAIVFAGALVCMSLSLLALFHVLSLWFEIVATVCFVGLFIAMLSRLVDAMPQKADEARLPLPASSALGQTSQGQELSRSGRAAPSAVASASKSAQKNPKSPQKNASQASKKKAKKKR